MRKRSKLLYGSTALVLSAALVACGGGTSDDSQSATATGEARDVEHVTVATSFGNFGRDGFLYVALDKGFYEDAGFDVTLVPGQGAGNMRLLTTGTIDFTSASVTGMTIQRATAGLPVRAVAVNGQLAEEGIAVLADSPIQVGRDLEGRSFADAPASTNRIMLPAYAAASGFDVQKVEILPGQPNTLPQLLASKRADSIGQYTVGQPLLEKATGGKAVRILRYVDALPFLLGNGIITTEERVNSDPEGVKRFVEATSKGLAAAFEDPDAAGQIMAKYVGEMDPKVAADEIRILKDEVLTTCSDQYGVGYIDSAKMQKTAEFVQKAFDTPKIDPKDLYASNISKVAACEE